MKVNCVFLCQMFNSWVMILNLVVDEDDRFYIFGQTVPVLQVNFHATSQNRFIFLKQSIDKKSNAPWNLEITGMSTRCQIFLFLPAQKHEWIFQITGPVPAPPLLLWLSPGVLFTLGLTPVAPVQSFHVHLCPPGLISGGLDQKQLKRKQRLLFPSFPSNNPL